MNKDYKNLYKSIPIIILFMFILSGCTFNKKETNNILSFKTEIFENKDIRIQYPNIISINDSNTQDKLNMLIKNYATDEMLKISLEEETGLIFEEDIVDINYEITLNTRNYISIKFLIKAAKKEGNLATKYYYDSKCITINLKDIKIMTLSDWILDESSFNQKIKKANRFADNFNQEITDNNYIEDIKKEINNIFNLNNNWLEDSYNYYVSVENIGLIIITTHADGDYAVVLVNR